MWIIIKLLREKRNLDTSPRVSLHVFYCFTTFTNDQTNLEEDDLLKSVKNKSGVKLCPSSAYHKLDYLVVWNFHYKLFCTNLSTTKFSSSNNARTRTGQQHHLTLKLKHPASSGVQSLSVWDCEPQAGCRTCAAWRRLACKGLPAGGERAQRD